MFSRGDFHIHSTASDGLLSPQQIVTLSKTRGIDTIAVSDHNSIDGLSEAFDAGKKYDVSVIPAVELSTRFNDESIHILGYFRNEKYNCNAFKEILKQIKAHEAYKIGKTLFGYDRHLYSNKYLSTLDGISLLKIFDASVVLAHPVRISEKNLPEILAMPFDGIEAKYCSSNEYYTNYFINIASEKFSFYTAGSDFHSENANDDKHGIIGEPCLNADEIKKFLENSGALTLNNTNNVSANH